MKEIDLKKLSEPMEYKTRVWPGGTELAYIDARQAQDRLDEVCWIENWKVEYAEFRWELFAWVSIRINWEWVTKWDWWSESNIEKEKGAISDSFKRACVTWGLWRFLYSIKATKSTKAKTTNKTDEPIPNWYNDLPRHKEAYIKKIRAWELTPELIIKSLEEKWYKLGKTTKEQIMNLS